MVVRVTHLIDAYAELDGRDLFVKMVLAITVDCPFWPLTRKMCVDVDECRGSNRCHRNAECRNNVGSYTCTCRTGFAGNGYSCSGKSLIYHKWARIMVHVVSLLLQFTVVMRNRFLGLGLVSVLILEHRYYFY